MSYRRPMFCSAQIQIWRRKTFWPFSSVDRHGGQIGDCGLWRQPGNFVPSQPRPSVPFRVWPDHGEKIK